MAIVICASGIFNYSGFFYDVLGNLFIDDDEPEGMVAETKVNGKKVKHILTEDGEIFYNWGHGVPFYVIFLSLLFMATIVLEGVDTSIMAKVTPPKLNEKFINGGLLATLIGTLGRVIADSILTGTYYAAPVIQRHQIIICVQLLTQDLNCRCTSECAVGHQHFR